MFGGGFWLGGSRAVFCFVGVFFCVLGGGGGLFFFFFCFFFVFCGSCCFGLGVMFFFVGFSSWSLSSFCGFFGLVVLGGCGFCFWLGGGFFLGCVWGELGGFWFWFLFFFFGLWGGVVFFGVVVVSRSTRLPQNSPFLSEHPLRRPGSHRLFHFPLHSDRSKLKVVWAAPYFPPRGVSAAFLFARSLMSSERTILRCDLLTGFPRISGHAIGWIHLFLFFHPFLAPAYQVRT